MMNGTESLLVEPDHVDAFVTGEGLVVIVAVLVKVRTLRRSACSAMRRTSPGFGVVCVDRPLAFFADLYGAEAFGGHDCDE